MITYHRNMMTDWIGVLEPFLLQAQFQDNPQVNHQGKIEQKHTFFSSLGYLLLSRDPEVTQNSIIIEWP